MSANASAPVMRTTADIDPACGEAIERRRGVRRRGILHLEVGDRQVRIRLHGQGSHREPMRRRGHRAADGAAGCRAGTRTTRSRSNAVRAASRDVEMAAVHGIERPAEQSLAHHAGAGSVRRRPSRHMASSRAGHAFARHGEDGVERDLQLLQVLGAASRGRSGSSSASILLATAMRGLLREQHGGVVAPAREHLELARDHVEVLDRVAAGRRRHVDHVHEHLRAFEMREELRAEAVALVRAFDQARHVGHDEAPVVAQPDDAEVRASAW